MNENKRLLVMFGVIIAIVLVILVICFWPKTDKTFSCKVKGDKEYTKLGAVNYEQYECLSKKSGKTVLVVSDDLTNAKKKALNTAAKKAGRAIYYLDTKNITSDELKEIKKDLKYSDNAFEKDAVLVLKKGDVDTYKEDILSKAEDISNFFKEAKLTKFACNVESDEEYKNLGVVDYEQYNCLYESGEPFALILAQTTCGYCTQFKPIIDEYAGKNNVPVYIIQINELSEEDRNALIASLSYFKDNENWGTPLTLGIENKEVKAEINGYTDSTDELDTFFKTLGLK